MQRIISFIVVCVLSILANTTYSQQPTFVDKKTLPEKIGWTRLPLVPPYAGQRQLVAGPVSKPAWFPAVPVMVSGDYYNRQLGFVCKKEWRMEKATHIPLRLRLGSLDYCNMLEGKTPSR